MSSWAPVSSTTSALAPRAGAPVLGLSVSFALLKCVTPMRTASTIAAPTATARRRRPKSNPRHTEDNRTRIVCSQEIPLVRHSAQRCGQRTQWPLAARETTRKSHSTYGSNGRAESHRRMSATRLPAVVLLSVTAAGVICGCAVGPSYHKPEAPAGAGYAPAPLAEASSSAPIHGGEVQRFVSGRDLSFEWWELFQSPALDSLIKTAFKANPTLAAAQASLAQAQELVSAQRGYFFPTVAAVTQAERHKVSGNTNASSTIGVLAQVRTTLPPLEKQFEQTRDLIRALAGKLPNDEDQAFELDALQLPPEVPVSLPAKLIEQRPDVRAAEAQLHAANAQVGVAVAAMLPQFSITGQYGGNATQIPWMFRHGGPFWSLYGDVRQPVFQGGTLLHQERAAKAALRQAAAQYQSTVIAAYRNVADSLHESLADAETLSLDLEAENSAKVTYDLTRQQMQVGYVTYLTLLAAETAYQQTLLTRVQAQATRYGDTVALFQALGGGWWNRREVAAK
jgi:outer membrane protein TolC